MVRKEYLCVFLLGFVAGFITSQSNSFLHSAFRVVNCEVKQEKESHSNGRLVRNAETNERTVNTNDQTIREDLVRSVIFNDSHLHADNSSIAERLFQQIRILCLVMTFPENHESKAIHVNATWGRRCNKLLFVTRRNDSAIPTLIVDVDDGREHLGKKTRAAFNEAFAKYLEDYDWFMKADDDTYVIMENLRYFLSGQDPKMPVYFGRKFVQFVKQGYASGGAAYVVSREGLSRFGQKNHDLCSFDSGFEDVDFGYCMERLEISLGESHDSLGRTRFHCFRPELHVQGNYPSWFKRYDEFEGKKMGIENMSDYAITFHYIRPHSMYTFEYLIYHLNPYGIIKGLQNLNTVSAAV